MNKAKKNKELDRKLNNINEISKKVANNKDIIKESDSDYTKLMKIFGFSEFKTTKYDSHIDSDLSGVFKGSKIKGKSRQYMNRKGGFNKPLDKAN